MRDPHEPRATSVRGEHDSPATWLYVVGAVLVALFLGGLTTALCKAQAPALESGSDWRGR